MKQTSIENLAEVGFKQTTCYVGFNLQVQWLDLEIYFNLSHLDIQCRSLLQHKMWFHMT